MLSPQRHGGTETEEGTPWTENIELLLRLLRRDYDAVARCIGTRIEPLDTFFEFATTHRLSVVVLGALRDAPVRSAFPEQRIADLERIGHARVERTRTLLVELEHLAERLTLAGQRFLLLKGPYLAARFFGDPYGREYVDLDVLVPYADREQVFRLLTEAGYRRTSRVLLGAALTGHFVHGFDFTNGRAKIDLHWELSRHPSFRLDEAKVWTDRQSYVLGIRTYDVLADEYNILLAVLAALRDLERGRWKIRNLVDLLRMLDVLDHQLDWHEFFAARERDGTLGPAVNILALALEVAGSGDLFSHLRAALPRYRQRRIAARFTDTPLILAPARLGLGNKLWSARVHDTSFAAWFLWWATSLPFRTVVHRRARRQSTVNSRQSPPPAPTK